MCDLLIFQSQDFFFKHSIYFSWDRVLLCNREESRPGEAVARAFLKPVSYFFPTAITVPVEVVSHAMINNLVSPAKQPVEVYENKAIHQLSGISSGCGAKQSRSAESSKAK